MRAWERGYIELIKLILFFIFVHTHARELFEKNKPFYVAPILDCMKLLLVQKLKI